MSSSFESVLMAPGQFSIECARVPDRIKRKTARAFSRVIICPRRNRGEAVSEATLLARAVFVGILYQRGGKRQTLEGFGLPILLGGPTGLANTFTKGFRIPNLRPLYDGSNPSWVYNYVLGNGRGGANGLTVGTIASSSTNPAHSGRIDDGAQPLDVLNDICRRSAREWRISTAGALSVASQATLWPTTTTPTAIAMPDGDTRDANIVSLTSVQFRDTDDWRDYTTEVTTPYTAPDFAFGVAYAVGDTVVATSGIYYRANSAHTSSGANLPPGTKWDMVDPYGLSTLTSPYVGIDGNPIVMRRVINARTIDNADDADDLADKKLARFDVPQREITVTSTMPTIYAKSCSPGDTINVLSRDDDLYDMARSVPTAGRVVHPTTARVHVAKENVSPGHCVLLRSWNGSAMETDDVSEWVQFDDPLVTLELGQPRRRRPVTPVSI